ncbi:putative transcriptional regulator, GntR family protein [Planomonospora parontospora subsp. parontospora]|uniref:Transcriptional regulator, GntR family protein n=2 Tax=Planomonospora parontospora TaxID=58119 RepID=A0AA37BHU1_9ACTN|nr:PLP-dependent aminotransferase family protein [Planomonospora parontospora]GGK72256.1 putative transcriptional regulator, GntR family protein [Planomonospora parontospora]GII09259.1 putative transcriptional regulator, GntR family protein [Planomonospora parontospora subsp. parontospora]
MRPPSYRRIADELAAAIRTGAIPAGTRLPTHRGLARERRIALATATRVYAELAAMGLVTGEPGRGTFVRHRSGYDGPEPSRALPVPRVADLSFNQPLAPDQGDRLRTALRTLSTSGEVESLLRQHPPGGRSGDRAVVAAYLLGRGIDVAPANVLLTGGTQQALDVTLRALTRPGDVLAVDALSYPGIRLLAAAQGLDLAPVPVTAAGPDLAALDRLCRTRPVRAIYTIPTVHNPLGWVLDRERRAGLAAVARAADCVIVEDGTYAFLEAAPPPPLQALAPERTCYVAGLSKNVATGLRFGFAVVPDRHVRAVTRSLRAAAWSVPALVAALATGWITDGTVEQLERARREDAAARQDIARNALAGMDVVAHPASYIVWLGLEPHQRPDHVAAALAEEGILVSTSDAFATGPRRPRALRLALGTPPLDELASVLHRLRRTVEAIPP